MKASVPNEEVSDPKRAKRKASVPKGEFSDPKSQLLVAL